MKYVFVLRGEFKDFRDDCDHLDDHMKLLSIWTGGSAHYQCNEDGIMMTFGSRRGLTGMILFEGLSLLNCI